MRDHTGDAPLVTVGIPTYNRPAGLKRTLDCIVNQTYRNLQIIVSDNCSPGDETANLVQEYQSRDPRIVYHRQATNLGIDGNFKFLLASATGTYFFWAADDDEWTHDFIDVCLSRMGTGGAAMTGQRVAVRSRGLLRPKPTLNLSLSASCFNNAVAFFTNLQPSLFYGLYRTDALRIYLDEFMHDYYDCFFILRHILTHGFQTDPRFCFHIGVESDAVVYKPARKLSGAIYEYWPFYSKSMSAVYSSNKLSTLQKIRLYYLLTYFTLNEFVWFERTTQRLRVAMSHALMVLMRATRPLFRVPLPDPPPTLRMPSDPAEAVYMHLPAAEMNDLDGVRKHLNENLEHLRAKQWAVKGLEVEIDQLDGWQRLPWRWLKPIASLFARKANPTLDPPPEMGSSLEDLRRRLGLTLLAMEEGEAYVQRLLRQRTRARRRDRFRAFIRSVLGIFRRRPAPQPPANEQPSKAA